MELIEIRDGVLKTAVYGTVATPPTVFAHPLANATIQGWSAYNSSPIGNGDAIGMAIWNRFALVELGNPAPVGVGEFAPRAVSLNIPAANGTVFSHTFTWNTEYWNRLFILNAE